MKDSKEFTVEAGILVQTQHLMEWKQLLKPKVYKALEKWALKFNHKATNGYQITRGSSLNNFVANYLNGYTPKQDCEL